MRRLFAFKKLALFLLLIYVLSLSLYVINLIRTRKVTIWPNKENYWVKGYEDTLKYSTIDSFSVDNNSVRFDYTLRGTHEFSYVGIMTHFEHDLRGYDEIEFVVDSTNTNYIEINLNYKHKSLEKDNFSIPLGTDIKLNGAGTYRAIIKDLTIPSWIFEYFELEQFGLEAVDYSKAVEFQLLRSIKSEYYKPIYLQVSEINVVRSRKSILFVVIIGLLIPIGVLIFGIIIKKLMKKKVHFKIDNDKADKFSTLEAQILSYVAEHYVDSDLTIETISLHFSVTPQRVIKSIQKKLGLEFKEYLLQLRIEEATRLLQTTDLSIGDIAQSVGFKHLPVFSSEFKRFKGVSPKQFKKL